MGKTVQMHYHTKNNEWWVYGDCLYDNEYTSIASNRDLLIDKLQKYTTRFCDGVNGKFNQTKFDRTQYTKIAKIVKAVVGDKVEIKLLYF